MFVEIDGFPNLCRQFKLLPDRFWMNFCLDASTFEDMRSDLTKLDSIKGLLRKSIRNGHYEVIKYRWFGSLFGILTTCFHLESNFKRLGQVLERLINNISYV